MAYTPQNIDVYTAAFSGAIAGIGVPSGAYITDPIEADYIPITNVATVYAQAVDTAWGVDPANDYDIEAIADASTNLFVRGAGYPFAGVILTQGNWTIVATALVAMIKAGDATATAGGIVFPTPGGGVTPPPFTTSQQLWVAATWGSDTTGTGSIFKPFQTISHAQSVITDASSTKVYEIILYPGEYTESVALKAFTEIVGFDLSQAAAAYYPANISGDISLGTSFATAGAIAWFTNLDLSGQNLHIDFVAASSTDGILSITNSQIENNFSVTMGADNNVEFHGTTLIGEYLQTGGYALWENTAGSESSSPLIVKASATTGATLRMFNSCWNGNITADQNGNSNSGQIVSIEMINSQARNGTCALIASGNNVPSINAAYGDLPENPDLSGSATVVLNPQMRVSVGLLIPPGTQVGALTTNDVALPLPTGVIGASSIEEMSCTITPSGSTWGSQASTHNLSWSTYVLQNGTVPEVHVSFYNPTDSTVTLTNAQPLLFYAFLPSATTS